MHLYGVSIFDGDALSSLSQWLPPLPLYGVCTHSQQLGQLRGSLLNHMVLSHVPFSLDAIALTAQLSTSPFYF